MIFRNRRNTELSDVLESLEEATKRAMETMERKAEERELEQELKQLNELKAANKHITETDDSELNDAQKQLKEFLLESQHEVSRRKEALKKHVENLEKDTQEAAERFNSQVEVKRSKQHDRLMARLKKRQKNKGGAFGNIAASAMGKKSKVKSTKVVPVKKKDNNRKPSKARPPPPPPKKKA